jgi:TRAP-type C4-dicarboxylate transport system permease small subunit
VKPEAQGEETMPTAQRLLVRPLEAFIAVCMAVMLVLVFGNVALRYAFNSGIVVSEELSRLLFVWLVFVGAIVALFERRHLGVDTLVVRLSRRGRLVCFVLSHVLMLYVTWLIFNGALKQAGIGMAATTPVMGISQAWYYAPILIFAVVSAGWFVLQLFLAATGRISDEDLIDVRESEEDLDTIMHHRDPGPDSNNGR